MPGIIAGLREIDADIIALQEVDIGCERSGRADVGERDPHFIASSHQHHIMLCSTPMIRGLDRHLPI